MKIAVISPSGKFYGSEQTLFSFLTHTRNSYDVYVSRNDGSLLRHLDRLGRHNTKSFKKLVWLYVRLFILLLQRQYSGLYVNEGGHIKYIKLLARFFPHRKFFVHIRINEDATKDRLNGLPSNVELISVSSYIKNQIKDSINQETTIISSPLRADQTEKPWRQEFLSMKDIRLGIIGRVTDSKGIGNVITFYRYLVDYDVDYLSLHFFGNVEKRRPEVSAFMEDVSRRDRPRIEFHGFIADKDEIFDKVDVVVHFNENEPLGVIFFESLKSGVPFIGFNGGGIGDIAYQLEISDLMLTSNDNWCGELVTKVRSIHDKVDVYEKARKRMDEEFSLEKYCVRLESKFA